MLKGIYKLFETKNELLCLVSNDDFISHNFYTLLTLVVMCRSGTFTGARFLTTFLSSTNHLAIAYLLKYHNSFAIVRYVGAERREMHRTRTLKLPSRPRVRF